MPVYASAGYSAGFFAGFAYGFAGCGVPGPPVSIGAPVLPQWVPPSVPSLSVLSVPKRELFTPPTLELSAPGKEPLLPSSVASPVQSGGFLSPSQLALSVHSAEFSSPPLLIFPGQSGNLFSLQAALSLSRPVPGETGATTPSTAQPVPQPVPKRNWRPVGLSSPAMVKVGSRESWCEWTLRRSWATC